MHGEDEPDQTTIVGYSIDDPDRKAQWIALVRAVAEMVDETGQACEIVFHGTSLKRARDILVNGLRPTDIHVAVAPENGEDQGSFWGDVQTAAAYAEDTVKERDGGGLPVLLAARTSGLASSYAMRPDLATLDFPLKGLTRLGDEQAAERWRGDSASRTWQDSLADLGAVVVIHDADMPPDRFAIIEDVGDLSRLAAAAGPKP